MEDQEIVSKIVGELRVVCDPLEGEVIEMLERKSIYDLITRCCFLFDPDQQARSLCLSRCGK